MDEREFERIFESLVQQDPSVGTEAFRESLLERCLAVLEQGDDCLPLDDADLDLLAAAGDLMAQHSNLE